MTMPSGANYEEWKAHRTRQDDLLYEKYGKPLETEHAGEFVAISNDGQIILGESDLSVLKRANREFGRGHYALRKIGADFEVLILATCPSVLPDIQFFAFALRFKD